MKLFNTDDIHAIEQHTFQTDSLTSLSLTDRVGEMVAGEIASRFRPTKRTVVFAGPGGNGADALIAAFHLFELGFKPLVYLFNIGGNSLKSDCKMCRDMIVSKAPDMELIQITKTFNIPDLSASDLVIDGLFGSGLREPLTGGFMSLVRYINESEAHVVSIDVPSGLFGDWNLQNRERNMIHAKLTLAVQFPRISFFFSDNADVVGQWKVLDVGLSHEAIEKTKTNFHLIEGAEIKSLLKPRKQFCSKADFGSGLLVAGRYGMVGASVLAARGALRSGIGKLTVYGPQCSFQIVQAAVPEALFEGDSDKFRISEVVPEHDYSAIGVGPGIGTSEITVAAVEALLQRSRKPLVIDADALNCIARRPSMLDKIPKLSVLTPHAAEFDRIFGEHTSDETRLLKALEVSSRYTILILLKGHYTKLVRPDGKVYINSSGSPAMATAGSGDVLTGILLSLMAQGYKPEVAAIMAAYIHGRAGEIAASEKGIYGTVAGDIADATGAAIRQIMTNDQSY
ncbi:MAG: NAD(P)H-hydrate dehydratase [Firmicutes bacterium]|nr:NAD(P)H-hydrate dehydratase [Bacillota bacterium]MCM1401821.1 NAD(P)H-hydrate dehydratase [Bacteroides sp.]MCM1477943.1 NAD(P)H-hydrate dehydratase [Bacteroides sp.]